MKSLRKKKDESTTLSPVHRKLIQLASASLRDERERETERLLGAGELQKDGIDSVWRRSVRKLFEGIGLCDVTFAL